MAVTFCLGRKRMVHIAERSQTEKKPLQMTLRAQQSFVCGGLLCCRFFWPGRVAQMSPVRISVTFDDPAIQVSALANIAGSAANMHAACPRSHASWH